MLKEDKQKKFEDIVIHRIKRLETAVFGVKNSPEQNKRSVENSMEMEIDLEMPIRAFMKKYARSKSGPKKFTLLLSRLSKGNLDKEVSLKELERIWNRMAGKSLLGGKFNRFYPAEARDKDWVDLRKKGTYSLRPSWRNIFDEKKTAKK